MLLETSMGVAAQCCAAVPSAQQVFPLTYLLPSPSDAFKDPTSTATETDFFHCQYLVAHQ